MKRQIERDLWVFCQALTEGVGKKWVCIGSASLAASTKNIPALRSNMTLENHNFKQTSSNGWVFHCHVSFPGVVTTSIPKNIPRIYPKTFETCVGIGLIANL